MSFGTDAVRYKSAYTDALLEHDPDERARARGVLLRCGRRAARITAAALPIAAIK